VLGLSPEQKLAFLLGLRPNPMLMTQNAVYRGFAQNYLFDQNLLVEIFSYVAPMKPPVENIQLGIGNSAAIPGWEVLSLRQLKLYATHFVAALVKDGIVALENIPPCPLSLDGGGLMVLGSDVRPTTATYVPKGDMVPFQVGLKAPSAQPELLSGVHNARQTYYIGTTRVFYRKNGGPVKRDEHQDEPDEPNDCPDQHFK